MSVSLGRSVSIGRSISREFSTGRDSVRERVGILNPVDFDGATRLEKTGDLTGNADGKEGIFSIWFKSRTTGVATFYTSGGPRFRCRLVDDGGSPAVQIEGRNAANTIILQMQSSAVTVDTWHHIVASWNLGVPGSSWLYVNGVSDKTLNTFTDDTIDYTRTVHAFGAVNGGGVEYDGCLAQAYLNFAESLDLDIETNLEKFYNGGPVNLGPTGALPTGNSSIIFFDNQATTFEKNLGTGTDFSVVAGAVKACADGP